MRIGSVLNYYIKNFLYIMIFVAAPAIFIGVLLRPFSMVELLCRYPTLEFGTFGEMFTHVYDWGWWQILAVLAGLVLVLVCVSLLIGKIEGHFRTGKMELISHEWKGLNYNLAGVTKSTMLLGVVCFVLNTVSILLIYFMHFIFAVNIGSVVMSSILIWVIGLANMVLQARLVVLFLLAGLDSIIMGSPYTVALSNASQALSKDILDTWVCSLIPFVVMLLLTIVGTLLGITVLTNILSIMVFLPWLVVYSMIRFFDHYNIPRYDIRQYYVR
ncbi:MAG: hypothetical protein IKC79_03035 [Clostridia bacterium]|nr:hypothetical protein [Clostridia bacterium]